MLVGLQKWEFAEKMPKTLRAERAVERSRHVLAGASPEDATGGAIAPKSVSSAANAGLGPILLSRSIQSRDSIVDHWLNKIDQLIRIHDWTDYEITHCIQLKLVDPVKG